MSEPIRPVAVMAAMDEELGAVMADLELSSVETIAGRPFHLGLLHGVPVVLVCSRIGKVAAATTTTLLINHFGVRAIVFVGLAGAVSTELSVGDIVVADRVLQHDLDVRPLFPRWEIPGLGVERIEPPSAWLAHGVAAAARALSLVMAALGPAAASLEIVAPTVRQGLIASGDQFIGTVEGVNCLRDAIPDLLAVEMEGAAMAQVAFEAMIPWLLVRTISDSADHHAGAAFPKFLAEAVGPYARALVSELLTSLPA